jgi:ParB-like chromosome segregation protein Spo0J
MKKMNIHPVAEMLPYLRKAQFNDLVEDIKANGVKVPVLVNKAKDTIIDGRSRWMAAADAGIKEADIPLIVFKGKDEDIPSEILSRNLFRRHLSEDQRIMLVVKIRGKDVIEAAAERKKGALSGTFKKGKNGNGGSAVDQLAKEAKVSTHKAQQAITVFKAGKAEEVMQGKKLRSVSKSVPSKKRKPIKTKSLKEIIWNAYSSLMKRLKLQGWNMNEARAIIIGFAQGNTPDKSNGNGSGKSKAKAKKNNKK